MKVLIILLFAIFIVMWGYFYYQSSRFNEWIASGHQEILSFQSSAKRGERSELPELLQRYLKKVILKEHTNSTVFFTQKGDFRNNPDDEMSPFKAEQFVSISSPMFSWVANINMKGIKVKVCDRLVNNEGELQARLFSALTLAKGSGASFLRGELLRYMAELPWYPMAILNLPQINWKQLSDNQVEGVISIFDIKAAVNYTFSPDGLIESVYVSDRERSVGESMIKTPWLGEFSDYKEIEGQLLPTRGMVSWLIDSKKFTYFSGTILDYQFK